MPPVSEILDELKSLGTASVKNVLLKHGIPEPLFGVKIEHLKKIQKRIKKDYQLALDLYDTGVYDAMYLAGLIADDENMTKKDLQKWAKNAKCAATAEYTVAWVAAGSPHGRELALDWIDSKKELIATAGWATYSSLVAITPDGDLEMDELKILLSRVALSLPEQPNRVRYVMNAFVIAVGSYVKSLTPNALRAAKQVGQVLVDMGETACKVPSATEYIAKVQERGSIGTKRATAKC